MAITLRQELNEIISELKEVISNNNLNISNDILFSEGCGFLRGRYASQRWQVNSNSVPTLLDERNKPPFVPATSNFNKPKLSKKQIEILKKKKFSDFEINNMTFDEVGRHIEQYFEYIKLMKGAKK
jgi:hypothetical protein